MISADFRRTCPTFAAAVVAAAHAFVAPALAIEVRVPVAEVWVLDGDTVDVRIEGRWERVRLPAIDAPETRDAVCEAERVKGKAAAAALIRLVRAGREARVSADGAGWPRDRFGRILGHLAIDGADAGAALIAAGHALPWRPGADAKAERQRVWCGR